MSKSFNEKIQEINSQNYSFGNDILYNMAAKADFNRKGDLASTLWLIGRSYAASPERRYYGKYKINSKTEEVKKSVWPILKSDDGRGDFFSAIEGHLLGNTNSVLWHLKEGSSKIEYKGMFDSNNNIEENNDEYKNFVHGIELVLNFNKELSSAIEIFDKVPSDNKYIDDNKEEINVHCNNHISFCSKFLHFYLPELIYIYDSQASSGGDLLFNNKRKDKYFVGDNNQIDCKEFTEFIDSKYENLLEKINGKGSDEEISYIRHCVRSYLLGLYIKNEIQINNLTIQANINGIDLKSMNRLTDTVFLNIKGKSKDDTNKENVTKLNGKYCESVLNIIKNN